MGIRLYLNMGDEFLLLHLEHERHFMCRGFEPTCHGHVEREIDSWSGEIGLVETELSITFDIV